MIDFIQAFFLLHLFDISVLIFGSFIYFVIAIQWNKIIESHKSIHYREVQKIHEKQIARVGGVGIFINLIFFTVYNSYSFNLANTIELKVCLFTFVPIFIVTLFEDLHIHLKPIYRLIAMIVSTTYVFLILGFNLPTIDFPIGDFILNAPTIKTIIFISLLIALINGFNFIDGANGLMTTSFLVAMGSLFTIAYMVGDVQIMHLILLLIIPFIIFLFFNYPFGNLFIGDIGAYLSAWLIGLMCFSFFAQHEELTTWSMALILFYPFMEVTFSFFRKIYQRKSPFEPDADHLHLKLFFFLKSALNNRVKISNNLVMPFMTFFWLTPPVTAVIATNNILLTISALIFFVVVYCLFYLFIPSKDPHG